MKFTSALILGLFSIAIPATSNSQIFSITVSPSQVETKSGSPIRITVRLTNISDSEINLGTESFVVGGVDARFHYDCRSEGGKSVAREYPELGNLGDRPMIILQPGEIHTETINITPACELSEPGTYEVQLSRELPNSHGTPVKSNTIAVTVAPKSEDVERK